MTRPVGDIAATISARARSLDRFVTRMERLRLRGDLTESDLDRIYTGAYLAFYTYFERAIERAFIGLVMGRLTSSDSRVKTLVSIKSERVAHRVVAADRSYADWIPYRLTIKRADALLSAGRPFREIPKADVTAIDNMSILRNAIAHDSAHSLRRFRQAFTDGRSLPPRQQTPAGYLRGQHAVGQTRLNFLLSEAVALSIRMMA